MPDARAVITRMYESDDTIIVEGRLLGTHTGPLAGPDGDIEATGRLNRWVYVGEVRL